LALGRRPAGQQILDADVFVEFWPVGSLPLTDKPPATLLVDGAVNKPRIPRQRRRDGATVGQFKL
jgi:hypothetical protein